MPPEPTALLPSLASVPAGDSHHVARLAVSVETCARWLGGVLRARDEWTPAFGGEQFSLGLAFYAHLEEGKTAEYFAGVAASDARVERHAPGLQAALRALLARAVGGRAIARPGWCGAGVHVFPAHGHVSAHGGVVHFDTEGLAAAHVERRRRAVSVVLVLQPPVSGGETRLWPILYRGEDTVDEPTLRASTMARIACEAGDALVFDSYQLHQIAPFGGALDRVSATLHGAEVDDGLWETWF